MPKSTDQNPEELNNINDFERSLSELEGLVQQLEKGELSLEDSLKQFERGIELARGCQLALKQAELKVRTLVQKNGIESLENFADDSESGNGNDSDII